MVDDRKKTLLQYSSLPLLMKECYEEEVQPYLKTYYKPIIYISTAPETLADGSVNSELYTELNTELNTE